MDELKRDMDKVSVSDVKEKGEKKAKSEKKSATKKVQVKSPPPVERPHTPPPNKN